MNDGFMANPHKTLLGLSVPVLVSLIAEPVTGLVDTAFVAKEGVESLAALGVGTLVLSSSFWIFSFLGVGTQTQIALASGGQAQKGGRFEGGEQIFSAAIVAALGVAALVVCLLLPLAPYLVALMGGTGEVGELATTYIRLRMLGGPAVLITIAGFGALRGLQDMKTPLWIALSLNVVNIGLDMALIPSFGVAGAAIATAMSQWFGALWVLYVGVTRLGLRWELDKNYLLPLFKIGRDMFIRTGLLSLFLILGTRKATLLGAESGAAHQAVRQVWLFTALFLDAFAVSGQSLVGFRLGAGKIMEARKVAQTVIGWSFFVGCLIGGVMLATTSLVSQVFVPPEANGFFEGAWFVAAVSMPINGMTFGTDGIHNGAGDFPWLRNTMIAASCLGALALGLVPIGGAHTLTYIWLITAGWVGVRALFGLIRIWPGIGRGAPMRV